MAGAACDIEIHSSAQSVVRGTLTLGRELELLMAATQTRPIPPRWYWIPARVVLVSFLLTLLSFAMSLLLGIVGLAIQARLRGVATDMTFAYRHIALPVAAVIGIIALIGVTITEIKDFRQMRALAEIERSSR